MSPLQIKRYWKPHPSVAAKRRLREFDKGGFGPGDWCLVVEVRYPTVGRGPRMCVESWAKFDLVLDDRPVHEFNNVFGRGPYATVLDAKDDSVRLEFRGEDPPWVLDVERAESRAVVAVLWPPTMVFADGSGRSPGRVQTYRPTKFNRAG